MAFLYFLLFLIFLLIFITIITFIHELGHFYIARRNKVRVSEFSIGFGPAIFQRKLELTTISIRLFPLGGYVAVLTNDVILSIETLRENIKNLDPGERELQEKRIQKKLSGLTLYENFKQQKTIDKVSTVNKIYFALGGILFNFVSIFIALAIFYTISGREVANDTLKEYGAIFRDQTRGDIRLDSPIYVSAIYNVEGLTDEEIEDATISDLPLIATGYDDLYEAFDSYQNAALKGSGGFIAFPATKVLIDYKDSKQQEKILVYNFSITENPGFDSLYIYNYQNDQVDVNSKIEYTLISYINLVYYRTEGADYIQYPFIIAIYYAFIDTFIYIYQGIIITINLLFGVFTPDGRIIDSYHNVDGNNNIINVQVLVDFFVIFSMITLLFNIIPLPPLDGFHAVRYGYEGISKKSISKSLIKILTIISITFMFIWFFFLIF
ncbi:MAG: hypothetical protein HPPSJP_1620 [Candidatus Hepatoplasma scabrum]|nr:MAG: hypothetical protein HPPSJP_1620 [Candidatus Hepatoplasma sp.]